MIDVYGSSYPINPSKTANKSSNPAGATKLLESRVIVLVDAFNSPNRHYSPVVTTPYSSEMFICSAVAINSADSCRNPCSISSFLASTTITRSTPGPRPIMIVILTRVYHTGHFWSIVAGYHHYGIFSQPQPL